ncbi:MAG TPA: hypothetical protein VFT91_11330 [Dehalococcoidia bacterium]|nr:hypothetical protein [Dehalococcoidia bacterium]
MMDEVARLRLLAAIVDMLNKAGSWTGRTHIQKFIYFAQELLGLPTGYEFVLYQRGPYCFELDADIRTLRSIGAVDISPAPPYGPSYVPTELGKSILRLSPVGEEMTHSLTALSKSLGRPKQARDLELLATTLFAMNEGNELDEDIIQRVLSLKPQFQRSEVEDGLSEVRGLRVQFRSGGSF